jgi:hypothetical protein
VQKKHPDMKLKLHEAIVVVLLSKPNRTATTHQIADEINQRNLYNRKDNEPIPAYQVMQRTKLSNGQYHHLFEFIEPDKVKLKNS